MSRIGETRIGATRRRTLPGEDAPVEPRIGERGGRQPVAAFDPEAWARDWTYRARFRFVIPGVHYSGLTNEAMREVFENHGRDFFADTTDLRDHVAERVAQGLADRTKGNDLVARRLAKDAYREWIVWRFEHQGPDVRLKPLSPEWLAIKRKEGSDERIGIRRGNWLRAVSRGRVDIDTE